jgi:hypothetical protein
MGATRRTGSGTRSCGRRSLVIARSPAVGVVVVVVAARVVGPWSIVGWEVPSERCGRAGNCDGVLEFWRQKQFTFKRISSLLEVND